MRILVLTALLVQFSIYSGSSMLIHENSVRIKSLQELCILKVVEASLPHKGLPIPLQKAIEEHATKTYLSVYDKILNLEQNFPKKEWKRGDFNPIYEETINASRLTQYISNNDRERFSWCMKTFEKISPHDLAYCMYWTCCLIGLGSWSAYGVVTHDTCANGESASLSLTFEVFFGTLCGCACGSLGLTFSPECYSVLRKRCLPEPRSLIMELPDEDTPLLSAEEPINRMQHIQLLLESSEEDQHISDSDTDY